MSDVEVEPENVSALGHLPLTVAGEPHGVQMWVLQAVSKMSYVINWWTLSTLHLQRSETAKTTTTIITKVPYSRV